MVIPLKLKSLEVQNLKLKGVVNASKLVGFSEKTTILSIPTYKSFNLQKLNHSTFYIPDEHFFNSVKMVSYNFHMFFIYCWCVLCVP
jgi:hypothetical protein